MTASSDVFPAPGKEQAWNTCCRRISGSDV